jgi:mannose-6-phosphate isomerase-like protein (cupin superfamily)
VIPIHTHVKATMRERLHALQTEVRKLPQWEPETFHHWADGMYCRVVPRPAGVLIIGKVHKREHFYLVMQGTVVVTDGDGEPREITGPHVIVSHPGTKRAVYAKTDAVCCTVHRTDKRDLEELEAELVEPFEDCPFLPGNILKEKLIT